ncbi:MAG: hypothetical protein H7125_03455 [Proteobacteria bacterium]|nr:hypothetical protein [Burkholderiales bacterium]
MIRRSLEPAMIIANAAVAGIDIVPSHLPMIEAGLASVCAALAQAALPLAFEAEPAQFEAQRDAHALGAAPANGAPVPVSR